MTNRSTLSQLTDFSVIVADTGELAAIEKFKPEDATTNPSLLLKVAKDSDYQHLLKQSIEQSPDKTDIAAICDRFSVIVGSEISSLIPGRISTEVPAQLSYNTEATVAKARTLVALYKANGIDKSRLLIKVAGTWEGIQAAEILEKEGINCNITLIFNLYQAIASAEANAFLISPFVGRILDWHKANRGFNNPDATQDPGVLSVKEIYQYYKSQGFNTIVMGASFRSIDEIIALAGCDRLTISPQLLDALEADQRDLKAALCADTVPDIKALPCTETDFRWHLSQDEMAYSKLGEGIRKFHEDYLTLEQTVKAML